MHQPDAQATVIHNGDRFEGIDVEAICVRSGRGRRTLILAADLKEWHL